MAVVLLILLALGGLAGLLCVFSFEKPVDGGLSLRRALLTMEGSSDRDRARPCRNAFTTLLQRDESHHCFHPMDHRKSNGQMGWALCSALREKMSICEQVTQSMTGRYGSETLPKALPVRANRSHLRQQRPQAPILPSSTLGQFSLYSTGSQGQESLFCGPVLQTSFL